MTTATKRIEPIDISDHPEVVAERDRLADVEQRAATIDAEIRRRATPTRPDRDEQAARFIDGHLPGDEDATRRAELVALQKDRQTARRALELQRARVRVAEREAAVELLSDRRDEYGALARAVGKAAADFLKACDTEQRWREAVTDHLPEHGAVFDVLPNLEGAMRTVERIELAAVRGGYMKQREAAALELDDYASL